MPPRLHSWTPAPIAGIRLSLAIASMSVLSACIPNPRYSRTPAVSPGPERRTAVPAEIPRGRGETGVASYYGREFKGRPTASGERFSPSAMTAAHRTLPLGTRVRVVNLDNGKSVVVRINDRGPHKKGRVIDLSTAAAQEIGMIATGTARVRVEVVK